MKNKLQQTSVKTLGSTSKFEHKSVIKGLYKSSESHINFGNEISQPSQIVKGRRKRCCISPTIFKNYATKTLKQWKRKCREMVILIDENPSLYSLQLAEDKVIGGNENYELKYMSRKFTGEYEKWILSIFIDKTNNLCIKQIHIILHDRNKITTCSFNSKGMC